MFDMTTILVSLTVVEIAMAFVLVAFWRSRPETPGLREIAATMSVAVASALATGIAARIHSPVLGFLGIVGFVAAILLACRAMRLLQGRAPRRAVERATFAVAVAGCLYFMFVAGRTAGAMTVVAAVYAVACGLAARDLLGERHVGLRDGCRILGVLFALFAAFQAVRAALRPFLGPHPDETGPDGTAMLLIDQVVPLDHAAAFAGMAAVIGWGLGFVWASYRNAEYQLRAANRELEHFARAVAHDLKSPLTAVIGYLEAVEHLRRGPDSEQTTRFIAEAHEAALRMNTFIGDLLEQARTTQLNPEIEAVDPAACARDACVSLARQITEAGASVDLEALPRVKANRLQLTRVFQNLLDNAIKYRAPARAPEIAVTAERRGGRVRLHIRDNGSGIPEAARQTIFRPFGRSGAETGIAGHGFGLSECRRILESYGGTIEVASDPGAGSTFSVVLPAAD